MVEEDVLDSNFSTRKEEESSHAPAVSALNTTNTGGIEHLKILQRKANRFPDRLYKMLEYIDLEGQHLAHIVSWQHHGRSFVVHNVKLFEEQVLEHFFNQKHYSSFCRQLNLWDFKRIVGKSTRRTKVQRDEQEDQGSYYHECFLRTKWFLLPRIKRSGTKSSNGKFIPGVHATTEPNFFAMQDLPASSVLLSFDLEPCQNDSKISYDSSAGEIGSCYSNSSTGQKKKNEIIPSMIMPGAYEHQWSMSGPNSKIESTRDDMPPLESSLQPLPPPAAMIPYTVPSFVVQPQQQLLVQQPGNQDKFQITDEEIKMYEARFSHLDTNVYGPNNPSPALQTGEWAEIVSMCSSLSHNNCGATQI
jgi:hypothetical protein